MRSTGFTKNKSTLSPDRLAILAKKIYNKSYVDNAIQRIATVLSRELVEDNEFEKTW
jgi:hypothetical protein